MRFLKSLPGKLKGEVEQVINDEALDFAEKFTFLNDLIDDPDILLQVLHHLKTNKKKEEKKSSEENWKTTMKADPDVSLASDGNRSIDGSTCSLAIGSSTPLSHKPESDNEKGETPSRQPGSNSQTTLINEDLDEDEMKENEEYDEEENSAPNFFNHMKRIFGDPKKHEPPVAAKETDTTRHVQSPISFAEGMKPDCVKIIHETVVSSLSPTAKYAVLASIYREDESVYKKFTTWWNNQPGIALGQSLLGVPWPQSVFDGAMKTLEDWTLLNRSEKSKSACLETDASAGYHEVSTQDSSELTSIPISKLSVPPKPIIPPAKERSESLKFNAAHQPKIKAMNILLLGDIGVGKTTFINGLANYLKYETLDEAMAGEPRILVDASFRITGNDGKPRTITVKANTGVDANSSSLNERLGVSGRSSTQEPMDHVFEWMHGGEKKLVRIVDSPGFYDFCGTEENEKNMDKILKHVAELGELHAVCVVMKPHESKFTVGFRYCFDEVIQKLPKDTTKNILFCFTNTRSTLYRPGDTIATLHEFLENVHYKTGILINARRHNIFCYDNESFRYLCLLRELPDAQKDSMITFSESWVHNVKECDKMLKRIGSLTPVSVEDALMINDMQKAVTALAPKLVAITRDHIVGMKQIQEQIKKLENLQCTRESQNERPFQDQVVLVPVPLLKPRTVCTSQSCVEYVRINERDMQSFPKRICHDDCFLEGTPEQSVNNSDLAHCIAFGSNGLCKVCGCSWQKHMHTYQMEKRTEKVPNVDAMKKWEEYLNEKKRVQIVLKELNEKLDTLRHEHDLIRESRAEFAVFLTVNAHKQICDPFAENLNYLVQNQCEMFTQGADNGDLMLALVDIEEFHLERVKFITEEIKDGRRDVLSTLELNKKLINLDKLEESCPAIAKLLEVHMLSEASVEVAVPTEELCKKTKEKGDQLSNNLARMTLGSHGRKTKKENLEETRARSSTTERNAKPERRGGKLKKKMVRL